MKIAFICGCLEPGQDGVGDYIRRLAAELHRQKHQINIIALHDRRIEEAMLIDNQQEEEQIIPVLRLSSQLSWNVRIKKARTYIDTVNPDWISLQYVPFSFHDKGLSVRLVGAVKQIGAGRPMHIMFHEVWLGLSKQSSRWHIIWGLLQRQLIISLLKACNRPIVHTHTPLYQHHLNGLRIQSSLLPLFSNIPVVSNYKRVLITDKDSNEQIHFVFFGGIFPNVPVKQFTAEVAAYAKQKQKTIDLILIGRNGPEQAVWISAWRAHGLSVKVLGDQTPEQISVVLGQSTIGLSTTPVALAGKSGSIAAMHAHSLPVLCISNPWTPRMNISLPPSPGITSYVNGQLEDFLDLQTRTQISATCIRTVANQFLYDITL